METRGQPGVILGMEAQSFCLYVVGRLRGITRERLATAVQAAGGRLARTPSSRVDLVALSHSSALITLVEAPPPAVPAGIPPSATLISEFTLRRRLGLLGERSDPGNLAAEDVQRASGLSPEVISCLGLFDVLQPVQGQFALQDLRAAREVRRLLDVGYGLDEIVEASLELRQAGRGLHDTGVTEAPWGELMQLVGGRVGSLNGQYVLPLEDEECLTADELVTSAEKREEVGDLHDAERLYRIALKVDRYDPVIPFNLGNVLDRLGRSKEALLSYQQALARDPLFVEAWVNIAALQEAAGKRQAAEAALRRALACSPEFPLALHNLGLLLTRDERYSEAILTWQRYLATKPAAGEARLALRLLALCRQVSATSGLPEGTTSRC